MYCKLVPYMLCTTYSSIKFMDLAWSSQDTSWQSDEGVLSRWTCSNGWGRLGHLSGRPPVARRKIKAKKSEVWNLQKMVVAPVFEKIQAPGLSSDRNSHERSVSYTSCLAQLDSPFLQRLGGKVHGRDLAKLRRTVALMEELKSLGRKRLGGLSGSVGWCTRSLGFGVWGLGWTGKGPFGHPVIFPIATKPERKYWLKVDSVVRSCDTKLPRDKIQTKTINNALLVCIL